MSIGIKVKVRKTDKDRRAVYKWLTLGSNIAQRLSRPAWNSTDVTGGLTASNHDHNSNFCKNFDK